MRVEIDGRKLAAAAVAVPVAAVAVLNQYAKRHIVPPEEVPDPYPGDDLLTDPETTTTTMAIEIDAPREKIWPLLNQLGQDKAGFYSFSMFERGVHFLIHNTYTPQERWQHTKVGDWCFFGQQGIGMEVVLHEPGHYWVGLSDTRRPPTQDGAYAWLPAGTDEFAWTWGFFLEDLPNGRTRLLTRTNAFAKISEKGKLKALIVAGLMWGWSSNVMLTRMLEGIKYTAEGRPFLKL